MARISLNNIPSGQSFEIYTLSVSNGTQTAFAYLIMFYNKLNKDFANLLCRAINNRGIYNAAIVKSCTAIVGDENCQQLQLEISNCKTGGVIDVKWFEEGWKLQERDYTLFQDYFQVQLALYGDDLSIDLLFDAEILGSVVDYVSKKEFNSHKDIATTVETRIDNFFGQNNIQKIVIPKSNNGGPDDDVEINILTN